MKKLLLSVFALALYSAANAQCNELFISEYVEGSSNNKALEIYNPTPNAIALNNNYRIVRYRDGASSAAAEATVEVIQNLGTHVIPSRGAWVIVLDKRDAAQPCPGTECAVDLALQAVADTFLCPVYFTNNAMYFNGNDAMSLQKFNGTSWNYVDIFGMMGDAAMVSGVAWSDAFPYDGSAGAWWTINQTLFRKSTVTQGVTSNPSPEFIVTTQWDSLPQNTFDSLGSHTCSCPVASITEIDNSVSISVFPNPTNLENVTISATEAIISAQVMNGIGQIVIMNQGNKNDKIMTLETAELSKGVYFVKVSFEKGKSTVAKLSIQ